MKYLLRISRVRHLADFHHCVQIPRCNRVHVSENQISGEIAAELLFVLLADDGKLRQDVIGVVSIQAVETEEQGIQPRQTVTAVVFVPDERLAP